MIRGEMIHESKVDVDFSGSVSVTGQVRVDSQTWSSQSCGDKQGAHFSVQDGIEADFLLGLVGKKPYDHVVIDTGVTAQNPNLAAVIRVSSSNKKYSLDVGESREISVLVGLFRHTTMTVRSTQ